ncbi:MAG: TlpA family protein disulfide reductase [Dehalococcoidia bacterium]|nr:TlpA family protein disulfide reductase [Dehalococcoidia bacterium]
MKIILPPSIRLTLILAVTASTMLFTSSACGPATPGSGADTSATVAPTDMISSIFSPDDGKMTGAAPVFSGQTYSHGTFDLSQLTGKPVLINFWFPSCPPCAAELPDLQAAYEKYKDRVAFVAVQQTGIDSPDAGKQFFTQLGVTIPAFPDSNSKVQIAYRVLSYPTTVFLDKDHNIVRKWTGLITAENLEKHLQVIAKG